MRFQGSLYMLLLLIAALGTVGFAQASEKLAPYTEQGINIQVSGIRPMNGAEQQSIGCMAGAAAAMAATYAIGPSEVVMLMVGGVIVPSSPSVLFASLVATMASMGCVGGAIVTPLAVWTWDEIFQEQVVTQPTNPPNPPKLPVAQLQPRTSSSVFEQGIGCIVAGGASAIMASFIGASETLMVAAGGMLVPSTSSTLWLGIVSTLVASTCSMGAVATPGLLWAYDQSHNIASSLSTWEKPVPVVSTIQPNFPAHNNASNTAPILPLVESPTVIKEPRHVAPENASPANTVLPLVEKSTALIAAAESNVTTPHIIIAATATENAKPNVSYHSPQDPGIPVPPSISLIGGVR